MLIAGKKFPSDKQADWPTASKTATARWLEKHPAYNTYSTRYLQSQRRFLFLADLDPHLRFEAFEKLCFQRNLAPTTAESYWTTWLSVQKMLGFDPCDADPRTTKVLKARSTAYPVQFPTPMTKEDMDLLVQTYSHVFPSLAAIVSLAFLNGQRISDAIQIAVADVVVNGEFVMITMRRGKTMSVSQPYTLWLRKGRYPSEDLLQTMTNAQIQKRLFLFTEFNTEEERSKVLQMIKDMLTSVNEELELRSIRRGGLQRMASLGFTLERILNFSRHSDTPMLMRYLGWGKSLVIKRREMIEVTDAMMAIDQTTT